MLLIDLFWIVFPRNLKLNWLTESSIFLPGFFLLLWFVYLCFFPLCRCAHTSIRIRCFSPVPPEILPVITIIYANHCLHLTPLVKTDVLDMIVFWVSSLISFSLCWLGPEGFFLLLSYKHVDNKDLLQVFFFFNNSTLTMLILITMFFCRFYICC